jgi:hypothetical protein
VQNSFTQMECIANHPAQSLKQSRSIPGATIFFDCPQKETRRRHGKGLKNEFA